MDETNQLQLHKELFWENTSNTRIIHSNTELLDFRFVENGRVSEPNIVTIYNTSNEKVKLKWQLNKPPVNKNSNNLIKDEANAKEIKDKSSSSSNNFNFNDVIIITPEEAIINRNSSAEFRIYFKPNKPEFYYFAVLNCTGTFVEKEKKDDNK